jgi:predicted nucleic acid-binding Zn ribbon protein
MTDEPEAACPTCGGTGRRLIFPVGIVFKGSGFYATDHRSQSGGGQAAKDGASSTPAKTEKKPDKKADTKSESASSPAPSVGGSASGSTG